LKQIFKAGVGHQFLCKGFMTGPLQFPSKLEISWQVEAILKKSHEHKIGCLSVLSVETRRQYTSSLPLAPKTFHFSIVHFYLS
jgi:hypothetical protein